MQGRHKDKTVAGWSTDPLWKASCPVTIRSQGSKQLPGASIAGLSHSWFENDGRAARPGLRARSSGSQLHLPSAHQDYDQVAVAHPTRVLMTRSFVQLPSSSPSRAAGCSRVRPHSAEGRRGFRFLPCLFFVPPSRPAQAWSPGRDLANFLRAVAEACSPQRFREENAVVRFISLS